NGETQEYKSKLGKYEGLDHDLAAMHIASLNEAKRLIEEAVVIYDRFCNFIGSQKSSCLDSRTMALWTEYCCTPGMNYSFVG
ncbi:hypothetical protein Tco_1511082, partial [Tanacetum coccineum]